MKRVLLLAGTGEARAIAAALRDRFRVTASLAGATARPGDLGVATRTGGFGGADGLRRFIEAEGIDLLIDATHPFAARMKANAAAQMVPVLHVIRPPWRPGPDERWTVVPDLEAAARALPADARAFLALGARHLDAFRGHPAEMLVRSVDAPPAPDTANRSSLESPSPLVGEGRGGGETPGAGDGLNDSEGAPASHAIPRAPTVITFIQGPPGAVAEETALLRDRRITHLVCRNSGGGAGRAKLDAARALGIEVIVIGRPPPPSGEIVESPEDAIRWALARAGD
ncbi:precorrin-6A/cobalt-precorrin-6A reductase [Minwuia thermotolerans]|uniref:Cobalt-precorrin-6A reductase n=1 Tax=Minwuia thermotolerans TaxID=2056226 RepID=A0A2M9G4A6_9PROT|nr:precorrin-6A/cobalt-precorrin-6A reductase [Minwuia thermotolerans]PJK30524.1 cobalt-precorrin-6A reductase [Minwuia thermotolerans]